MKFAFVVGAIAIIIFLILSAVFVDNIGFGSVFSSGKEDAQVVPQPVHGSIIVPPPSKNGEPTGDPNFMPTNFVGPSSPPAVNGPVDAPPGG